MILKLLLLCVVVSVTCHFGYKDLHGVYNDENAEDLVNDVLLSNIIENLQMSSEEENQRSSKFAEELYQNDIKEKRKTSQVHTPDNVRRGILEFIFGKKKPQDPVCLIPEPCKIGLPSALKQSCNEQREKDLYFARMWYQITDETKPSTIEFPFKQIPWLNQTIERVQFHYAIDEFESRYLTLAGLWSKLMKVFSAKIQEAFKNYNFVTYAEYKAVYDAFAGAIKNLQTPQYFGSYVDDPTYTDYVADNKWQQDDTFVQILLTGICPFLIRKVTSSGGVGIKIADLLKQLNPNFDFDGAITRVYGKTTTLEQAIRDERIFVLYHEEHNGIESLPDTEDKDPYDSRTMMNSTSPITILILNDDGELKLAAIQWDYKPDSNVYTPESPSHEWLLAKGMVSLSHLDVCQFKYHLGHLHFVGQVYCLFFKRHFSTLHPLYDIFKYHCEGTIPHITQAFVALAVPNSFGDKLFTIRHVGAGKLALQAYNERRYGMLNYGRIFQEKGLDDRRIKYNPVIQDAKLLWNEIENYAVEIVNLYYKKDRDVVTDAELQSYASEVSADGKIGKGKDIGFPPQFTSKQQLKEFLTTFMWRPVMHATVNYNLAPAYVPPRPSKLYKDTSPAAAGSYPHNLPDASVAVGATEFADLLANFRANRILDYHSKVRDEKLKSIAWNAYNRFHGCVNKELEKRNLERKNAGKLSIPYLMPRWLPSSIHI